MDTSELGTPIASSNGNELHLGVKKSTLDGNLDFFADLDSNTDVTNSVTTSNDSLESSSLTGLGLLLNGKDAHDLIRELGLGVFDKLIDDLMFLDWDGVGIDLFKGSDGSGFDESSELGKRIPDLFTAATKTSGSSSTTSAAAASSSTSASTGTKSSSSITAFSGSCCSRSFHVF
jgi:hypothetical protein